MMSGAVPCGGAPGDPCTDEVVDVVMKPASWTWHLVVQRISDDDQDEEPWLRRP
jgi:hypothetical protein